MASSKSVKKKKKATKAKPESYIFGRPTKYRKEFCLKLVEHMAKGKSFESFAGTIDVGLMTTKDWVKRHDDFLEAKHRGQAKGLGWFEDLGTALMLGTLRRVSKETYVKDGDGNLVYGDDGKPLVNREYVSAQGSGRVWSINMRNRYGFVEKLDVHHYKGRATSTKETSDMTPDELDEELARLEALGL